MGIEPKTPQFLTVTYKCRSKKRFAVLDDEALLSLMLTVGRKLEAEPRLMVEAQSLGDNAFVGTYALPTNNVLEIYHDHEGTMVGYLFHNFDVWMSYVQVAP